MASSIHFDTARLRLARVTVAGGRSLRDALHDVAVIAAETLAVARVSIWRYLDDRQAIRCHFLHQPGRADVSDGAILQLRELPIYARMLGLRRVVPVNDVRGDALADEFREPYFEPLGITAMLDAPVYHGGDVVGIVCHEHLETARGWTADDAQFAAAVADTVARLDGEAQLVDVSGTLGTYRRQVESLRHIGALGRLAAGMAHDFANVLLVADARAESVRAHPAADAAIRTEAQAILDANARGHRLVHSLLRLARPSSVRPRVVDVAGVMETAVPMMRMAAGSQVQLDIEVVPGMARVLIDPAELERCLVNLALNARDAMAGGGRVRCRAYEAPATGAGAAPVVTIEVNDDGHGMDADTLAQAFEPFFTTRGDAGTGLGLAVVQQTIVMAGGVVEAESAPGRGTTIRIGLPAIGGPA